MTQRNASVKNWYSTPDLALASTISLWYPIEAIDRSNPNKARFLFKKDKESNKNFNQLIEDFWKRKLRVEPQTYFNQLKTIKARLYEEK